MRSERGALNHHKKRKPAHSNKDPGQSVQFSSVAQSCPTLCDPVDCSTPGLPVHHQVLELAQTSCPWSRWCHPTISSSVIPLLLLPAVSPSIRVFSTQSVLHKELEFQLQHQSFQWIFRTDFLQNWVVGSPCSPRDSQESSPTPQFKSINSSALSFLYSPTLTTWLLEKS